MKENEFLEYQKNIKDFLQNKAEIFSCEKFASTIVSKIVKNLGD